MLTLQRAVGNIRSGQAPALELVEGLFPLIAGALLITPGFVIDTIGFLCLTPSLRRKLAVTVLSGFSQHLASKKSSSTSDVCEGITVKSRKTKCNTVASCQHSGQ